VRLLKKQGCKTLAIGDGANDVNMIQEAHVGIGVMGEEGKQAVNASDFAVPSFKYLKPMVLNYGRLSYYQNSQLILFFFYKNILFTIPQFFYAFDCYFSKQNIWNDWYMASYNLIFTIFNVSAVCVTNEDINYKAKYYYENMILQAFVYFQGKTNVLFNIKNYLKWILSAFLEGLFLYVSLRYFIENKIFYKHHENSETFLSLTFYTTIILF